MKYCKNHWFLHFKSISKSACSQLLFNFCGKNLKPSCKMSLQGVNCTCKKHRGFTFQIDAPLHTPTPRSTLACSRGRIRLQMASWRQLWPTLGAPKGHFWGAQSHLHWHWHWQGIGLCIWPTMVSVVSFDKAAYLIYQSVSKRFAVNPPQWDGIDGMALDF